MTQNHHPNLCLWCRVSDQISTRFQRQIESRSDAKVVEELSANVYEYDVEVMRYYNEFIAEVTRIVNETRPYFVGELTDNPCQTVEIQAIDVAVYRKVSGHPLTTN